ncbi:Ecm5p, partial [Coemansia sp. S17]
QLARHDIAPSTVARLLDEAAELNIDMDFEPLKQLKDTQFDPEKWAQDAAAIGLEESSREPLDVSEIAKLLDRAQRSSPLSDNYHLLRRLQQRALDLEARTNELVDRSERSGLVERPRYGEALELVADCDKFGRFEPSSLAQLRSTIAKVDLWWTEIGQMFSFDQHGGPLESKLAGVEYRLKQTLAIAGGTDDSATDLYCVCLGPDSGLMIECEACHEWYHLFCVNLDPADIQNSLFLCSLCDARARADKLRLLADYPTIGRIEHAVKESRSFGLVVGALDPLVTILLDAKSLVELLNELMSNKAAGSAQRMQQPVYLRSLLRALLGLGINLKSGVLDGLWAALSELLKHEPIPKIIPGATVTSRRSLRSKPASIMPAAESESLVPVVANGLSQDSPPSLPLPSLCQPQQQVQPQLQVQPGCQGQLDWSEANFVDDIPSDEMPPELRAMYMGRLEELGIYIMNPPLPDRDMGQGLVQARDAFSKTAENCLCNVKGSDLDDSNPMSFLPTIMCNDCSMCFHTECAQVSIPTARIITFNQLRIMANVDVDETDNIPMEPSRFTCPSCCLKANEQYKYAEIVLSD